MSPARVQCRVKSKFFTRARALSKFITKKNFGTRAWIHALVSKNLKLDPPPSEKNRFFEISNVDNFHARAPKFSKIKIWDILCKNFSFLKFFYTRARETVRIQAQSWMICTFEIIKKRAEIFTRAWKFFQKLKIWTFLISVHAVSAKNIKNW